MTSTPRKRALLVDDDPLTCQALGASLQEWGYEPSSKTSVEEARELLETEEVEVVISDLVMDRATGLDLCRWVADNRPDLPVIIMSGYGSMEHVTEALRAGAHDFIAKPIDPETLRIALERIAIDGRLREEVTRLRTEVREQHSYDGLVGRSRAMRSLHDLIARAAPSEASVLITGESGTGKELVARAIHRDSRRANGPFVAVNCAAMPETLLESELFGHTKGAFTDAKNAREGLFVTATGGTLFLDEIGDMPLGMQVKLLRALQERRVRPVGGVEEMRFDTRLIAATNRDIDTDVDDGRFRGDLFYRLNVVRIDVPPLRSRSNDALVLAEHFLRRFAATSNREILGISREAAEKISLYPFPGNVRELENALERAVALSQSNEIAVEDLPGAIAQYQKPGPVFEVHGSKTMLPMAEIERRYITQVLSAVAGNKTRAANVLRIDRKTLYRKLIRWEQDSDYAME